MIIHAPIQTREENVSKYERSLALLTAESLRVIQEESTGQPQIRVDVWNTVSQKIDASLSDGNRGKEIQTQLDRRYAALKSLGVQAEDRIALLDTDKKYCNVVKEEVLKGVENGTFRVLNKDMNVCSNCGYCISLAGSLTSSCSMCSHTGFYVEQREVLILNFDEASKRRMLGMKLVPSKGISNGRIVNNMYGEFLASKERRDGLNLGFIGLESMVLDPKVGLGMVGAVLERLGYGTLTHYVQGRDSLAYSLPFLSLFSETVTNILLTSMIPKKEFDSINPKWINFYRHTLPLLALSTRRSITDDQIRTWSKMASKDKALLDIMPTFNEEIFYNEIEGKLSDIWRNLLEYRVEFAYTQYSKLIKDLHTGKMKLPASLLDQLYSLSYAFIYYEN